MFIKADKNYEVKCTLGTIRDIEAKFGKPFFALVSELDKFTTTELISLLYVGVHKADKSVKEQDFIAACEDNLGLGELSDCLEQYVYQLQYPGLTPEEVQEKIEKKLERTRALKKAQGSIG